MGTLVPHPLSCISFGTKSNQSSSYYHMLDPETTDTAFHVTTFQISV